MSETNEGNGSVQALDRPAGDRSAGSPDDKRTDPPPEAFARVQEPAPPPPKKPPLYKRPVPMIIIAVVLLAIVAAGVWYYLESRQWESTDDAFIEADVTQISPRVAGHVLKVEITDNQEVSQNQVLVELDPADFKAKYDEAEAAVEASQQSLQQAKDMVASAEADLSQSQASEDAARIEAERAENEDRRYHSLPPQAVTQQQLINYDAAARSAKAQYIAAQQKSLASKTHLKSAQTQIEVAAAQVKQAEATLEQAKLQLGYTTIYAPIAGHVTNRSVNVGDYVQVGQALMALVPQKVYVIANYKETQLQHIKLGDETEIRVDAFPGHVFHGKVNSMQRGSGAAFSLLPPENATGNYVKVVQRVPVKITFDGEGYPLGPGMSVVPKVKID
jgi:membrane fusion protein (multidrug efflux system)